MAESPNLKIVPLLPVAGEVPSVCEAERFEKSVAAFNRKGFA
jgi:hypothetical protein